MKPWDGDVGSIQELFYGVSTMKAGSYKEAFKKCVRKQTEDALSKAQLACNEHHARRQKISFALGAVRLQYSLLLHSYTKLRAAQQNRERQELLKQVGSDYVLSQGGGAACAECSTTCLFAEERNGLIPRACTGRQKHESPAPGNQLACGGLRRVARAATPAQQAARALAPRVPRMAPPLQPSVRLQVMSGWRGRWLEGALEARQAGEVVSEQAASCRQWRKRCGQKSGGVRASR